MALVKPHGKMKKLMPLLLQGPALEKELNKAKKLKQVRITSRETSDLVMLGIGAFTPLKGFMGKADWKAVCDRYKMADGTFWPIPITLSTTKEVADTIKKGEDVTLVDDESGEVMATMKVNEKYGIDKTHECKQVYKTTDLEHPGVKKVMEQGDVNLAGPVKVLSEAHYPESHKDLYMTPAETRKQFKRRAGAPLPPSRRETPCTAPTSSSPRSPSRQWMVCLSTRSSGS